MDVGVVSLAQSELIPSDCVIVGIFVCLFDFLFVCLFVCLFVYPGRTLPTFTCVLRDCVASTILVLKLVSKCYGGR